jgi:hypothetical protein
LLRRVQISPCRYAYFAGFNFAQQYDLDLPSPRGTVSFINPWNTEVKVEKLKNSKKSKGSDRKHLATTAAKMESPNASSISSHKPHYESNMDLHLELADDQEYTPRYDEGDACDRESEYSDAKDRSSGQAQPSKAQTESNIIIAAGKEGGGALGREVEASLAKKILELPVNSLLNDKINKDKLLSDLFQSVGPAPTMHRPGVGLAHSSPSTFARIPTLRPNTNNNSSANSNANTSHTSTGESFGEAQSGELGKAASVLGPTESDSVDSSPALSREIRNATLKRNRTYNANDNEVCSQLFILLFYILFILFLYDLFSFYQLSFLQFLTFRLPTPRLRCVLWTRRK